jgi:integrase
MALEMRNGVWYWRKMVDGVAFNRSTKTDDRKLAETLARKWEHEAVKTVVYDGERPVTLYEAIDSFLGQRKHLPSYGSACQHMQHWKNALPNEKMKSLQKHQVQAVVTKRLAEGAAQNTISVFVTYWNAMINHCKDNKLSPGPKLDRVQSKRTRFRIINEHEEAAMLAATCPNAIYPGKTPKNDAHRQDNQDLLVCLLHLGARINEAQNLRWSDVDFLNNTILVRRLKGGDDTPLMMTKALRAVLDRRYAGKVDNWVFPDKAQHYKTHVGWVKTIAKRAGVDFELGKVTSHTFRHSAATRLLRAGMDIRKVQRFLGHKNIQSTLVYLHALPDEVAAQAVAVFDGN